LHTQCQQGWGVEFNFSLFLPCCKIVYPSHRFWSLSSQEKCEGMWSGRRSIFCVPLVEVNVLGQE
jgi:hypothetical protein